MGDSLRSDAGDNLADDAGSEPSEGARIGRSTSKLFVGTVLGNGIAWLLNFVLARIFTNETFGQASVVIAVASIFIGVSTMRLEVRSLQVDDNAEARTLMSAGLGISLWWAGGLSLAAGIAVLFGATAYWLMLGLMVFSGSLQLLGAASLTRRRAYGKLSGANLAQASGMSILQILFGVMSAGVFSLLSGFCAARLIWLTQLRNLSIKWLPWRALDVGSRRFAWVAGSSALINAVAGQFSILLLNVLYTDADTGNYAMAIRVLVAPLAVLSQVVAAAAVGEISALIRQGKSWYPTVRRSAVVLLIVGAVICGAAFVFANLLAPWLLGSRFDGAGEVIAILAVGSWLQFAVSPFSQMLNLTNSHRTLLIWDVSRLLLLSAALLVPGLLGAQLNVTLWCYSLAMTLTYILLFYLISLTARSSLEPKPQPESAS